MKEEIEGESAQEEKSIQEKKFVLKEYQSFNESNLMTLPIFTLKRKRIGYMKYTWIRDNKKVDITIKAPEGTGIPSIKELDVLLALMSLAKKQIGSTFVFDENNRVKNMPKVINFTYRSLAKEMGLRGFGAKTKDRLKASIESLIESTIYTNLAIRDAQEGEYVFDFDGKESCRILTNLKEYKIAKQKLRHGKLLSPKDIQEYQSVEIDDFFFKNLCNNYLRVFDYSVYKKLTKGLAKKLFLLLSQWSHGSEKYVTLKVLYAYLGVVIATKEDEYIADRALKESLKELIKSKFIVDFRFCKGEGVTFIFNKDKYMKAKMLDKYTNQFAVIARLREIGFSYDEIFEYVTEANVSYVAALLRYAEVQEGQGKVQDIYKYIYTGLIEKEYNIDEYKS